jgi:hypothetical protein
VFASILPEKCTLFMESPKYIGMNVRKESISIAVLNSSGKLTMESIYLIWLMMFFTVSCLVFIMLLSIVN